MTNNIDDPASLHDLAKMIDHSLLHPTMTDANIIEGCNLARKYDVATVCVKPYAVGLAKKHLDGSGVAVCAVNSFPHGNSTLEMKIREAKDEISQGATEIDTVINTGKVLGGDWDYVSEEIRWINTAVTDDGAILKVIFENDYLQDKHIITLCRLCSEHKVAFVKTSTGYGFVKQPNGMYAYRGATDHHLELMRKHCSPDVRIKAAGGIRSLDDLLRVRKIGVSRIGATATEKILKEARDRGIS